MTRLEEAIIKVCPDATDRPITLADVLRTIGKGRRELMNASTQGGGSVLVVKVGEEHMVWHLEHNLDGQSPETIAFLESILCKEV